jgi:hypothetical protein
VKYNLLLRITETYRSIAPDTAKQYARMGLQLSEKIQFDRATGKFFTRLGDLEEIVGTADSAVFFIGRLTMFAKKTKIIAEWQRHCSIGETLSMEEATM